MSSVSSPFAFCLGCQISLKPAPVLSRWAGCKAKRISHNSIPGSAYPISMSCFVPEGLVVFVALEPKLPASVETLNRKPETAKEPQTRNPRATLNPKPYRATLNQNPSATLDPPPCTSPVPPTNLPCKDKTENVPRKAYKNPKKVPTQTQPPSYKDPLTPNSKP